MKTKPAHAPGETVRIFGREALAIKQPNGSTDFYLFAELMPDAFERRRWSVTSEKGSCYAVSEMAAGWFRCSCPAATVYTKHGTPYTIGTGDNVQKCCKHVWSINRYLNPEPNVVGPGLLDGVPEETT